MAKPALGHILQQSQQGLTAAQFRQDTIPVFHLILSPELKYSVLAKYSS